MADAEPTSPHHCDVAIFGGGVAGLWLLASLRHAGWDAVLFESGRVGEGQTRHAQGIIHGGTKYALAGKLTASSEAIAAMPARWRASLAGEAWPDLTGVRVLSTHQYLWSTRSPGSRLAGFFASRLMRGRTHRLDPQDYPEAFRHADFRGQIYALDEPVIDTASLLDRLAALSPGCIHHYAADSLRFDDATHFELRLRSGEARRHSARRVVFAAGAGNAELLARAGREGPAMQLRPLKMVMARGQLPGDLFAHCLGASVNPRLTITSHRDAAGEVVWYLGGQLAEEGVARSDGAQIDHARAELRAVLPWLSLDGVEWATLDIDRAEPRQARGRRPDDAFVAEEDGILTVWPTKLALAPRAADQLMSLLAGAGLAPRGQAGGRGEQHETCDGGAVDRAPLPWQEEQRWK